MNFHRRNVKIIKLMILHPYSQHENKFVIALEFSPGRMELSPGSAGMCPGQQVPYYRKLTFTPGGYSHISSDGLCRPKGYTFQPPQVPEWESFYCIFEKKSPKGYHFSLKFPSQGIIFQINSPKSPPKVINFK